MNTSILPAGTGLTHLRVYTQRTPDGQHGGSPHLHLACAELYYVLQGCGAVEFLSAEKGYQCLELQPGRAIHFTPGVVHRLINGDGALEILVVMQNSGLPESGDAVFTFPEACFADRETYLASARVRDLESALRRRDLAVSGFTDLLEGWRADPVLGRQRLQELHQRALQLVQPQLERWRSVVDMGPAQAVRDTQQHLDDLAQGSAGYLSAGQIAQLDESDEAARRLGMCGWLWPYLPEGQQTTS
jgi:mannose-6-phosphate isomerase-like protein (cupin superfamily)